MELYIAPELELIGLTAEENLANDVPDETIDFDSLMNGANSGNAVKPSDADIDVPLIGLGW